MESAPQSTITHNAVIEFASDLFLFPTPRRSPRERRAHKKKAYPAQKGGLKSVGTLPKSYLRRNAAKGANGRFHPVFVPKRALFAKMLEMAIGQARERDVPALSVQESWGRRTGDDRSDRGHGHPGKPCCFRESLKGGLGERT